MSEDKHYGRKVKESIKALPLIISSRKQALFQWTWCSIIASMVASHGQPSLIPTLLVVAATFLIDLSVYAYNDYADAEMDGVSEGHKDRPMASKRIPKSSAIPTIVASGIAGLLLAWAVSIPTFIVALSWFIIYILYSAPGIRLKNRFILKETITTSGWFFCSLMASYAVIGSISIQAMFFGILFGGFTFLALPSLQDTFDSYEDGLYGVKSLARVLSWKRKVQLLGLAVLIMMTITPLTYRSLGFNTLLPISVVVLGLLVLRWGVYPLSRGFEVHLALQSRKFVYIYFLVIQVVLVFSAMSLGWNF